ncbi:hypothetical protein [Labrenzia sp. DG1229]|uniref:hypothetical protein n=1 Tax=Labrenzia sp. DG1229 TaxID=681847 RepID=UPI0006903802|nr:hypothetical protein [Labrenzia sp. DG1229]
MSSRYSATSSAATVTYRVTTLSEQPDLIARHQTTGGSAWPEFMLHDPVAIANWEKMMSYFAGDQLTLLVGDKIAAVVNMVPLKVEADLGKLPDRGVDWGVEKSVADYENGTPPNALMGLQIVVAKEFRGKKFSETATREVIAHARRRKLERIVLPVRPNEKHAFPLIPMDQYIHWKNPDGLAFDSWLRVHMRLGGDLIGICLKSMIIPGTVSEWEDWTGQKFPGSGQYIVPFALNPVDVDIERNRGIYVEPNVWVVHHASA